MSPTTSTTPRKQGVPDFVGDTRQVTNSDRTWPPPGWLTKKTAAERLNRSEPRIAAMAQREGQRETPEKPLKSRKMESPETKQLVTLIHEGDVERVLHQRANPAEPTELIAKPDKPESPDKALVLRQSGSLQPAEISDQVARAPVTAPQPTDPLAFLTIHEAAQRRGLPVRVMLDLLVSGVLPAFEDKARSSRVDRWFIDPRDLEELRPPTRGSRLQEKA